MHRVRIPVAPPLRRQASDSSLPFFQRDASWTANAAAAGEGGRLSEDESCHASNGTRRSLSGGNN
ncbi:hypothetical protein EYF80_027653 [Liparis tanakae]|uniref:Uncharacterized protein n=1 Tax=Liparis tanakae TaxID=230148 RepID=A0A4Z2HAY1_9TELE|nr:hypothetical protein EYF80_027653 [Liparis tanakae]